MRLTRFSAGGDGESSFSEVEIDLPHERVDAAGRSIASSPTFTSTRTQFVVLPAGLEQDWHPAPRRQLVAILSGRVEVDTPDGERRSFGAGDVFLADDVTTRGHRTRTVGGGATIFVVPVPEGGEVWSSPTS